jgi:DNA-binding ferritin-like protein (Dps family)
MKEKREIFINSLSLYFPQAKTLYDDHLDDCEGEGILWTFLFSNIGKEIGWKYPHINNFDKLGIINLIEEAVVSDDKNLGTAVCTGLLEAMTDSLMKDRNVWEHAQKELGTKSLEYMLGMNKFYGIE